MGKHRPDQLVLQDDPAFLPDLFLPNLDMDLAFLESSTQGSSKRTSLHSALSQQSSKSSHVEGDESILGLVIPTSGSGNSGEIGGFTFPDSAGGSAQRDRRTIGSLGADEGFYPDVDFAFDDDGRIIELGDQPQPRAETTAGPARVRSDSGISAQVRQELVEGLRAGQEAVRLKMLFTTSPIDSSFLPARRGHEQRTRHTSIWR